MEKIEDGGRGKRERQLQEAGEVIVVDVSAGRVVPVVLLGEGEDLLQAREVLEGAVGGLGHSQVNQASHEKTFFGPRIEEISRQREGADVSEKFDQSQYGIVRVDTERSPSRHGMPEALKTGTREARGRDPGDERPRKRGYFQDHQSREQHGPEGDLQFCAPLPRQLEKEKQRGEKKNDFHQGINQWLDAAKGERGADDHEREDYFECGSHSALPKDLSRLPCPGRTLRATAEGQVFRPAATGDKK